MTFLTRFERWDPFDEMSMLRNRMDFLRSFTLPTNVQIDDVKASYHEGLLEVTIPKKEEAKPRKIEVKTTKIIPERNVA